MRVFGLHLTWRGDCTGVSCDLTHLHGSYHDSAEFPSLSLFTALSLLQGILEWCGFATQAGHFDGTTDLLPHHQSICS